MAKGSFMKNYGVLVHGLALLIFLTPLLVTISRDEPATYLIPNLLLFTPYRQLTEEMWKKYLVVDYQVTRYPAHVPTIEAKDFSYEAMKAATDNFRHPAICRGLFKDAPALKKWLDPEYLPSRIGMYHVPVVKQADYGTLQNDREIMTFAKGFGGLMADEKSKMYLFFPVKSRFSFNGSDVGSLERLQKEVDQIILDDLQVDKIIWPGFGTKSHKTYFGSQIIIGRGSNDSDKTTGTGWHCAAGNNWFVQVAGRKRWYFMDQQYSAYMSPLRGGMVNMMTGNLKMSEIHDHIPLRYADVNAGDLLYNPDWQWHAIKNYEGLSIGCPIREVNLSLTFRNNFQYTSIVLINKLFNAVGIDIGGYAPAY